MHGERGWQKRTVCAGKTNGVRGKNERCARKKRTVCAGDAMYRVPTIGGVFTGYRRNFYPLSKDFLRAIDGVSTRRTAEKNNSDSPQNLCAIY